MGVGLGLALGPGLGVGRVAVVVVVVVYSVFGKRGPISDQEHAVNLANLGGPIVGGAKIGGEQRRGPKIAAAILSILL